MMKQRLIPNVLICLVVFLKIDLALADYYESKVAFSRHDYQEAYRQCIDKATQGNADCQNAIGFLYREGLGVTKNLQQAQRWFLLAANQQHHNAQYNLAILLGSGELGSINLQEKTQWMSKAAEGGIAKAQTNLGTLFSQGVGVLQSDEEAAHWWQKAAEQNEPMAQNNLGWAYATGHGVPLDPVQAQNWLQKALEQQHNTQAKELAQRNLLSLGLTPVTMPSASNSLPLKVDLGQVDALGNVSIHLETQNQQSLQILRLNGQEVAPLSGGSITLTRYVPMGESYLDVYAEDSLHHTFSKQYMLHRDVTAQVTKLPPLNPQQISPQPSEDAVAIIIGAEQYTALPRSDFSDNDAKSFYDYAVRALGVTPNRVKLLTGENAKRNAILLTLKNWLGAEVNKGHTKVYVFYSGHGLASPDGKARYLLPVDTNVSLLDDTAISEDRLIDVVKAYQPATLTLFLDSCYSGRAKNGATLLTAMRPISVSSDIKTPPLGVTILSSARGNELSTVAESVQHGLFSYYLMRGMQGEADSNHDKKITLEELFHYVEEHVSKESLRQGVEQNPVMVGNLNEVIIHGQ